MTTTPRRRSGQLVLPVLLLAGTLAGAGAGTAFATSAAPSTPGVAAHCNNDPGWDSSNNPFHCPTVSGKPDTGTDIAHQNGHGDRDRSPGDGPNRRYDKP